jgi:transcriptional regulator with XRE-family HTH domain
MADSKTAEPFLTLVGENIRQLRQHNGLTMRDLAEKSGVSRRILSYIELGQGNPSLVTISKIARALDTDFASLAYSRSGTHGLPELSADRIEVRKTNETATAWSSTKGSHGTLVVASTLRPSAEIWDWTLQPDDHYDAEPDPPGSEELFLVLSGTLTLGVGEYGHVLHEGFSARLATDRAYSYHNHGDRPVRFIRIAHVAYSIVSDQDHYVEAVHP